MVLRLFIPPERTYKRFYWCWVPVAKSLGRKGRGKQRGKTAPTAQTRLIGNGRIQSALGNEIDGIFGRVKSH